MTPRLLRKAALLIGATAVAGAGLVATPNAAFAADASIQPVVISLLPYCVQASDSPGRSAQLCINSVTSAPVAGTTTSESVTANGSVSYCTSAWSCTTQPVVLNQTGAGVNEADLIPSIRNTGTTAVPITQFCVSSTCTPGSVNVPSYQITLFPPGAGPLTKVCINGNCSSTPLAPVVLSNTTLNTLLASFSA
jgi:hypothetical protein